MWRLSILLLFAFTTGLMAQVPHQIIECMDQPDFKRVVEGLNDGEPRVETSCPIVLDFMECIANAVVEVTGFTLADLAKSAPDPDISHAAAVFVNIRDVVTDLCTEGTDLNQAYKENAECMESMKLDQNECRSITGEVFTSFREFEDAVQEEAGEDSRMDNTPCMIQAFMSACTAVMIHDKCGKSAFDIYQTLVKRSTVFSHGLCSQKDLETLKTKFVDSMDLGAEESDLFRLAFDLRRRRRK